MFCNSAFIQVEEVPATAGALKNTHKNFRVWLDTKYNNGLSTEEEWKTIMEEDSAVDLALGMGAKSTWAWALGMGVNLVGLYSTIHYGAPRSLEDYFQESG